MRQIASDCIRSTINVLLAMVIANRDSVYTKEDALRIYSDLAAAQKRLAQTFGINMGPRQSGEPAASQPAQKS